MRVFVDSEEPGKHLHTHQQIPTLIGCILLTILQEPRSGTRPILFLINPAAISEALNCSTTLSRRASVSRFLFQPGLNQAVKESAPTSMGALWHNSLTMSYFHTGIRTIIGAKAFHCPVRDGKEWCHLAMVIRHNLLSGSALRLVCCQTNS